MYIFVFNRNNRLFWQTLIVINLICIELLYAANSSIQPNADYSQSKQKHLSVVMNDYHVSQRCHCLAQGIVLLHY